MKGLALISLVVFLAAILSESVVQSRKCHYWNSGKECEKQCCGEGYVVDCIDSCVNMTCSSKDDCGNSCCSHGVCTDSCPLPTTASQTHISTSLIILCVIGAIGLLGLLCAPFVVCWCLHRRARRQPVIVTTLTRNGQLVARDDSVPLMSAEDHEGFSHERRHLEPAHGGPPPDYQV